VELERVGAPDPERLVGIGGRAGQQRRAVGQLEGVAVPLERGEGARRVAEDRVAGGCGCQLDGQEADLGPLPLVDPRAERGGQELRPEADAPDRHVGLDRLAQQPLLVTEPWMTRVLVGAHRAAHHHDRRELAPVGQRLALVELDAHKVEPARAQLVLERGRRFAGDVLKDE
jgi:hypothetical protein